MHKLFQLIVTFSSIFLSLHSQAFLTVGSTQDCDHSTIESAYDAVSSLTPYIFVANDQVYTENFVIEKDVYLFGGYNNCSDADDGILGDELTEWRGSGDTVVKINAQLNEQSTVILQRFHVTDGVGPAGFGGGIDLRGNSSLLLYNSLIADNQAVHGGGIRVSGADSRLRVVDSNILFNAATNGGGLYCTNDAVVTIEGNSGLRSNTASGYGGGLTARTRCEVTIEKGSNANLVLTQAPGISGNTADYGGGVAVISAGSVILNGELAYPARINGNMARFAAGVAVVDDNSSFESINGTIDDNQATEAAGGFYVNEPGASFSMRRSEDSSCFIPSRCSSLSGNSVSNPGGYAGAGAILSDGTAMIAQTHINGNRADNEVVITKLSDTSLNLEGNLIYDNKPFNNGVVPRSLFYIQSGPASEFNFIYNTLANNINSAVFELSANDANRLNVFNSVIFNLGTVLQQNNSLNNFIQADCSVMQETATLTGNVGLISTANPQFRDAANHDFRVEPTSVAVDMCDESLFGGAQYKDIDGVPRGYDTPKANVFGAYDAGAYELDGDLIFRAGFD